MDLQVIIATSLPAMKIIINIFLTLTEILLYTDESKGDYLFDKEIYLKIVSTFRLKSLQLLGEIDEGIIIPILIDHSKQNSLRYFKIKTCNPSWFYKIISLASKFRLLEEINIHWEGEENDYHEDKIKENTYKIRINNEHLKDIRLNYDIVHEDEG